MEIGSVGGTPPFFGESQHDIKDQALQYIDSIMRLLPHADTPQNWNPIHDEIDKLGTLIDNHRHIFSGIDPFLFTNLKNAAINRNSLETFDFAGLLAKAIDPKIT